MIFSISIILKFFVLLTPFFLLLLYIDICKDFSYKKQQQIAIKTSIYIYTICMLLLWFGNIIFTACGITLTAFQIGSGIILFLAGLEMIRSDNKSRITSNTEEPALIPLTLPITVGSGTIGYLFVLSENTVIDKIYNSINLGISVLIIYFMLKYAFKLYKYLGRNRLEVLSKLTGLFLSILAVQSILTGLKQVN